MPFKFFIRAYSDAPLGSKTIATGPGYKEVEPPLPALTKKGDCWVPWAVTRDMQVVYAPVAEARGKPTAPGLSPYTREVSQQRRSMCHTMLGLIALAKLEFSRSTVLRVSAGVCRYLSHRAAGELRTERKGQTKTIFYEGVGKYLYGTTKYLSFGRISDKEAEHGADQVWNQSIIALACGKSLSTVLNIHDGVGRAFFDGQNSLKITDKTDGRYKTYRDWLAKVRADKPGELFNTNKDREMPWRGRKKKVVSVASTLPGNLTILPAGFTELQKRYRGVDMYERIDPAPAPDDYEGSHAASGNHYFKELDRMNELFAAGASGTTGTALAAAFTFGAFDPTTNLERVKEYLFAIIGYLVGGGMHSLHESLAILKLLGLEYNIGTLRGYSSVPNSDLSLPPITKVTQNYPLLPTKFLNSPEFQAWRDAYYDIVVLGGTHWTYAAGSNW
jgi:hypothetical protein